MDNQKKADTALVLITFFWGLANVVAEFAMRSISPSQLNALRFSLAFVVAAIVLHKHLRKINAVTLRSAVILGAMLAIIYYFAMNGIKYSRSITTFSFIIALPVVITPLINYFFRKIVPEKKFFASLLLALAGLYMMTLATGDLMMGKGELLALFVAVIYAFDICYTEVCVSKPDVNITQMGILQIGFAALFLTIFAFITERNARIYMDVKIVGYILFLGIFSTALPFIVQPIAQQYTSSDHVGVIFTLEPVFSALAAIVLLGEVVSWREYLGGILMIIAVVLMNVDFSKRGEAAEDKS
ncbi:MAG: DMT family transporter [Clostridiales bacterium]|nr:DMT family transporter [Clostridiales bacterium]